VSTIHTDFQWARPAAAVQCDSSALLTRHTLLLLSWQYRTAATARRVAAVAASITAEAAAVAALPLSAAVPVAAAVIDSDATDAGQKDAVCSVRPQQSFAWCAPAQPL
jgi:hypothetical protein